MRPVPPQLAGPRKGSSEANATCEKSGKRSKAKKARLARNARRAGREVKRKKRGWQEMREERACPPKPWRRRAKREGK